MPGALAQGILRDFVNHGRQVITVR
jgi:hypothetical protein